MDDERQAVAYARADFSGSNQFFVDSFLAGRPSATKAIDIGCGPADVDIRLARAAPDTAVTAVDGSAPMLALAREAVRGAGLGRRIMVVQGRLPGLPFDDHTFDALLSKDLLHHLPDPHTLWNEIVRLGTPGAVVHVMDLTRPTTSAAARVIVETVSADEDPILKEDFYNSLCAAFTIDEVRSQLARTGLDLSVRAVSERHMLIAGRLP
jgi:ubiquinone/menaquinone biosynthesis C-methylase UbiE